MRATTSSRRRVGDQLGDHRRAAGRQFVDDRDIEVREVAHRQRARYRRGRQHQHVGREAFGSAVAQSEPLGNAKAVLLVNDRQSESLEADRILDQRVCADHQLRRAAWRPAAAPRAWPHGEAPDEPGRADAQRLQPLRDATEVLLGQQLGRCHQRCLPAGLDCARRGQRSHHGLAAADIALHQPLHRLLAREVELDLVPDALLRACQFERQRRDQARRSGRRRQDPASAACGGWHGQAQGDLLRHQFVEFQPLPGKVGAVGQRGRVGIGRRMMQPLDCGPQRGQAQPCQPVFRQQIAQLDRASARARCAGAARIARRRRWSDKWASAPSAALRLRALRARADGPSRHRPARPAPVRTPGCAGPTANCFCCDG